MGQRDRIFNVLSLTMLALTGLTFLCYLSIAINPFLPLNPFPPERADALEAEEQPRVTPTGAPVATWTPTSTPTTTPTPPPSFTPTITPTPEPTSPPATAIPPTPTFTVTPAPVTPRATRSPHPFSYEIVYETPYYGCSWMGVAGTVEDLDGNPLVGYPIHIWGGGIDTVVAAGSKQLYGDAGWEQFFTNQPSEVQGVFRVQIHAKDDPNHPPISEEIVLDFSGYCSQSLARIVFIKNH